MIPITYNSLPVLFKTGFKNTDESFSDFLETVRSEGEQILVHFVLLVEIRLIGTRNSFSTMSSGVPRYDLIIDSEMNSQ